MGNGTVDCGNPGSGSNHYIIEGDWKWRLVIDAYRCVDTGEEGSWNAVGGGEWLIPPCGSPDACGAAYEGSCTIGDCHGSWYSEICLSWKWMCG